MTATELAALAAHDTRKIAPLVSAETRENLAIARIALTVAAMDESIPAEIRIMRLQDGILALQAMLRDSRDAR